MTEVTTTTCSSLAEAQSQQTGVYSHTTVISILRSLLMTVGELEPRDKTSGIVCFLEMCEKHWAGVSVGSGMSVTH